MRLVSSEPLEELGEVVVSEVGVRITGVGPRQEQVGDDHHLQIVAAPRRVALAVAVGAGDGSAGRGGDPLVEEEEGRGQQQGEGRPPRDRHDSEEPSSSTRRPEI